MAQVNIRIQTLKDEEQQTGVPSQKKEEAGGAKIAGISIFVHSAINTGKQIINYGINNIGNFTGDYIAQSKVQNTVDLATELAGVGIAFATNWVAGVIALVGVGVKEGMNMLSTARDFQKEQNNVNYIRQLSGNSTKNGSRTGE